MRILFVIHQFMPEFSAGTENVTCALAKAAQRDGHSAEILTCSIRGASLWKRTNGELRTTSIRGIPVYGLAREQIDPLVQAGLKADDAARMQFGKFLDARPAYDLVHVTHPMRMIEAVEAVRDRSIPYLITLTDFFALCYRVNLTRASAELCSGPERSDACRAHCAQQGIPATSHRERYERLCQILFSAKAVVACSDFVADVFEREFGDLPIRVVGHGIDLLRFSRPARPGREKIVFGFLGTLSEAKGVRILAQAFAQAKPDNARLELIGPCYDDQFMKGLQQAAGNSQRIHIRAPLAAHQVPDVLKGFDVLCLPSLIPETFSLVQQEGFAAGVPCLTSDLGNPARVVRGAGCGEAIVPGDVDAWARSISRVSAQPRLLQQWQSHIPLPRRVEEETFVYSRIYRQMMYESTRASVA